MGSKYGQVSMGRYFFVCGIVMFLFLLASCFGFEHFVFSRLFVIFDQEELWADRAIVIF